MNNVTLANLENFGNREIEEAVDLMREYANGSAPDWFCNNGVTVEFNPNSGMVFLTNSDYEVLVMGDNGDLVGFHFLGYYGYEGTAEELWQMFEDGGIEPEDWEELETVLEMEGMNSEAEEVRRAINENENDS